MWVVENNSCKIVVMQRIEVDSESFYSIGCHCQRIMVLLIASDDWEVFPCDVYRLLPLTYSFEIQLR